MSHCLSRAQLEKIIWHGSCSVKVSKSFSKSYLRSTFGLQWTSLLISGHYIRDEACVSWAVLLASMTPRVPQGTTTLYWEDIGNSDASCLCGNNTHSCSAILQRKYNVTSMSSERRRQILKKKGALFKSYNLWIIAFQIRYDLDFMQS